MLSSWATGNTWPLLLRSSTLKRNNEEISKITECRMLQERHEQGVILFIKWEWWDLCIYLTNTDDILSSWTSGVNLRWSFLIPEICSGQHRSQQWGNSKLINFVILKHVWNKKHKEGAGEMVRQLNVLAARCSSTGHGFGSQHPHSSTQTIRHSRSRGSRTLSWAPQASGMHGEHRHTCK